MDLKLTAVYNANGGILGEAAYVIGHLLGTTSCSLCDITHSPIRRKPEWDAMVATLPFPLEVRHRNEVTPQLSTALEGQTLPVVAAEGLVGFTWVLSAEDLDACEGSPAAFRDALLSALEHKDQP